MLKTISIFAAVLFFTSAAVAGVPQCGRYSSILESLGGRFAESLVARGAATNGQHLEIFSSADGATWTAVIINPDGRACIVMDGANLNAVEWLPPGAGV